MTLPPSSRLALSTVFALILLTGSGCGGEDAPDRAAPDAAPADTAAAAEPLAAPGEARDDQPADVPALLAGDERFALFTTALDSADLLDPLRASGPFTVFAPTDQAFERLAPGALDELLHPDNRDQLRDVLLFHVVLGAYSVDALRDTTLMAQQAGMLEVTRAGERLMVDGATITGPDRHAGNGVVHAIDRVLLPESSDEFR